MPPKVYLPRSSHAGTPAPRSAPSTPANPPTVQDVIEEFLHQTSHLSEEDAGKIVGASAVTISRWRHTVPKRLDDAVLQRMLIHVRWYRNAAQRIYGLERRGRVRFYGDFRDFATCGGRLEPLIPPGEHVATADHETALQVTAGRLKALRAERRVSGRATDE